MNLVRGHQAIHGVDLPKGLVQVLDDKVHPIVRFQERMYVSLMGVLPFEPNDRRLDGQPCRVP